MSLTTPEGGPSIDHLLYQIAAKTGISLNDEAVRGILKDITWGEGIGADSDHRVEVVLNLELTDAERKRECVAGLRRLADLIESAGAGRP